MVVVSFKPYTYICQQDYNASSFYIITRGSARVTINDKKHADGEKEVARIGVNDFFGEVALLSALHRPPLARILGI